MKTVWYLLWGLLVIHLTVIPFWHLLGPKIIKKKFSRKIWNFCVIAGPHAFILLALLIPLIILSLKIARAGLEKERCANYATAKYENEFVDVRGQIHVHCYLSHDSRGSLEEITQAAKKDGVQWIIFTDHLRKLPPGNYPDQVNGVLLIYGCERNGPEGTSIFRASLKDSKETLFLHGHVEGFGSSGAPEIGGYHNGDEWVKYDAIELVNFHANALENKAGILGSGLFIPETLYDNITGLIPRNFDYWQSLAEKEGHPIPIFAGPDSHQNIKILGVQTDPYELTLGLLSTHIWLEKDKELNQETIFETIKKGRTYVAFDYLGDPTGFQIYAESKDKKYFTGETAEGVSHIWVRPPDSLLSGEKSWDTSTIEFRFYNNNQLTGIIPEYPNFSDDMLPHVWLPQPGFWRVEIWKNDKPWILSGQILVK